MKALIPLITLALAPVSQATYIFVDATPDNTTYGNATTAIVLGAATGAPGGPNVFDQTNRPSSGAGMDGYWTYRDNADYEGGHYFESDDTSGTDPEDTFVLVTQILLADIGTYDIVVVFSSNSTRDIAAKIVGNPTINDQYNETNGLVIGTDMEFDSSYVGDRGTRQQAAYLGQFTTAQENWMLQIRVDGLAFPGGGNSQRTGYDGVGFQLVPEPSSTALFGIGALASMFIRRRK